MGGQIAADLFARGLCLPSGSSLTGDEVDEVDEVIEPIAAVPLSPSGLEPTGLAPS